ncbi:MAG: 2-oxoacid:ferredoxin oxidoreductase subunit beta, partial [Caulobacteraceae bacterium]
AHQGSAILDVISPCVQFNNHAGSTKSFDYVREHNAAMNRLDFIEPRAEITVDYAPGEVELVTQHDGSVLRLRKLAPDYDPTDRISAISHLQLHQTRGEIVTGLLFVDPEADDLHERLHTVHKPLNQLSDAELIPGGAALDAINDSLR